MDAITYSHRCWDVCLPLPLFLLIRGEVLPATFSPPHLLVFPTLLCLLTSSSCMSPFSPVFFISLFTQSSHLSLGLPRLLLPCSRYSAALFGSLSAAILSTCPAHCNVLIISLSVKLLCTPVSSLNSAILRLSALVTLCYLPDPVVLADLQPLLLYFGQSQFVSVPYVCNKVRLPGTGQSAHVVGGSRFTRPASNSRRTLLNWDCWPQFNKTPIFAPTSNL